MIGLYARLALKDLVVRLIVAQKDVISIQVRDIVLMKIHIIIAPLNLIIEDGSNQIMMELTIEAFKESISSFTYLEKLYLINNRIRGIEYILDSPSTDMKKANKELRILRKMRKEL